MLKKQLLKQVNNSEIPTIWEIDSNRKSVDIRARTALKSPRRDKKVTIELEQTRLLKEAYKKRKQLDREPNK
jgi:hypothetical protein